MTTWRRATLSALLAGVAAAPTGGCILSNNSSDDCEDRTLDLREPPSREAVGLPPGDQSVSWSCDDGFDLTVRLPDEVSLELESREVGFSTYGVDAETAEPEAVDIQSTWLSIDAAVDLATRVADALDMDDSQIDTWRQDAQDPPDETVDTKTRFIRGAAGYVTAEMQVIHQSVSGNNNVHLILRVRR